MIFRFVNILAIIFAITCAGCSTGYQTQTQVREQTITAPVPAIERTLTATVHDTVVVAREIIKRDTLIEVKYNKLTNTIYVKVKPDSVKIKVIDTVQVFIGHTNEALSAAEAKGFKWGFGSCLLGLLLLAGSVLFLKSKIDVIKKNIGL